MKGLPKARCPVRVEYGLMRLGTDGRKERFAEPSISAGV